MRPGFGKEWLFPGFGVKMQKMNEAVASHCTRKRRCYQNPQVPCKRAADARRGATADTICASEVASVTHEEGRHGISVFKRVSLKSLVIFSEYETNSRTQSGNYKMLRREHRGPWCTSLDSTFIAVTQSERQTNHSPSKSEVPVHQKPPSRE